MSNPLILEKAAVAGHMFALRVFKDHCGACMMSSVYTARFLMEHPDPVTNITLVVGDFDCDQHVWLEVTHIGAVYIVDPTVRQFGSHPRVTSDDSFYRKTFCGCVRYDLRSLKDLIKLREYLETWETIQLPRKSDIRFLFGRATR